MELIINILIRIFSFAVAVVVVLIFIGLPILYSTIRSQRRFYAEKKEGLFRMQMPGYVFWLGFVVIAISVTLSILCMVQEDSILLSLLPFCFTLLGLSLSIYACKWGITIEGTTLTIHSVFHPFNQILLSDITVVKQKYGGIIGYVGEKRVFSVDKFVPGYDLFWKMLYHAGKMEMTQQKYNFTVRQHRGNIVIALIGALFFGGLFVYAVFWPDESVNSFVYIISFGLFASCIGILIYSLVWKININEDKFIVRNGMGIAKTYYISKITKVRTKNDYMYIYVGKEKAAKIQINSVNMPILLERLKSENISGLE